MSAFRDRALAKRMQAGDDEAFREYFDRFFTPLFRFALVRLGGESGDAEEMAQVALCKGISKLDTYRGEARLLTWLSTICRFEISALYKKRSRLPPLHSQECPEIRSALESLSTEDDEDPESSLLREELASSVEERLQSLPQNYSDALRWKYMEGTVGPRDRRSVRHEHEGRRIEPYPCASGVQGRFCVPFHGPGPGMRIP